MNDSIELLRQYASARSEQAFAVLIDRYIRLVYSSCWRQLRDRHLAEDATQAVFVLLSQKAASVHTNIAGWLLTAARYTCAKIKKMEMRRVRRETAVAMESNRAEQIIEYTDSENEELIALLDEGLARLRTKDREVIALRYFQGQPLRQVAGALGISEEAARKRLERCIEKLRGYFSRRGITTAAGALAAVLDEQAHATVMSPEMQTTITQGILHACRNAGVAPGIAAVAKGANIMMQLARLKIAAMAMITALAVLAAGWAMRVKADDAAPATGASGAASVQSPADAAYDACRQVFVSMIDAHDQDDPTEFSSQFYFSPTADSMLARIAPIAIDVDLAVYRVQKAAVARFGAHAIGLRYYWTTTDMSFEDVLSRVDRSKARMSGDNTMIFSPEEPFFPRAGIWPKAPIYFQKVDGVWKLDVARTAKIQIKFRRRVPMAGETQEQMLKLAEKGLIDSMNAITSDLNQGKIATAGDLQKRLDGAVIGVALTFSNFDVDFAPR